MRFVLSLFSLVVVACGSDSRAPRDAARDTSAPDSAVDSTVADAGIETFASDGPACVCGGGEGCLVFDLTRAADDAELPWIAFAGGDADGVGTLVVGALDPGDFSELVRQEIAAQDLTSPDWSLRVDLGCVRAGAVQARAFLDDNLNTMGGLTSADFIDACLDGRSVDATVIAGEATEVMGVITRTCD